MDRKAGRGAISLVAGFVLGIATSQPLMAQQAPVTRTMLQQKDLEGIAGREVVMYQAEFVPGGVSGRHTHPGPELLYVLEGTFIIEIDGQAPVTLKAGDSWYTPTRVVHNARNGSATVPAKVIVFLVGEKGQPLATSVQ